MGEDGAYPNGSVTRNGHEAVIVQHPRGQRWGAQVEGVDPIGPRTTLAEAESEEEKRLMIGAMSTRKDLVASLYSGIFEPEQLSSLDFVVVYVGATGSEGAIELAARAGKDKARFVMCHCDFERKTARIMESFDGRVPVLPCECGGRATMEMLVEEFLQTGNVGPRA